MRLIELRAQILLVPLVSTLPEALRDRIGMILMWVSEELVLGPGDRLFTEGESDTDVGCIVVEGLVQVKKEDAPVITVEAPSLLGEIQQFTADQVRTATVSFVDGGTVLKFNWHDFVLWAMRLLNKSEQLLLKEALARTASQRFWELHEQKAQAQAASDSDIEAE